MAVLVRTESPDRFLRQLRKQLAASLPQSICTTHLVCFDTPEGEQCFEVTVFSDSVLFTLWQKDGEYPSQEHYLASVLALLPYLLACNDLCESAYMTAQPLMCDGSLPPDAGGEQEPDFTDQLTQNRGRRFFTKTA